MYVLGGGYPLVSNGFTLIELLAVIVILAIIALIATPIILGIIGDSKESSTIRSAENYLHAVELMVSENNLGDDNFDPGICEIMLKDNQSYIKCAEKLILVEVNGTKPISGTLILENGEVVDVQNLKYDKYYVYQDDENKLVISKNPYVYPSIPELSGMTAVIYDGDNWRVADTNKRWYNYRKQEWANAVILNEGVTKNIGDILDVSSEVKAMFVWIPRYEYKLEGTYGTHTDGTVGTIALPGEIKVKFVSKDTTEASEGYIIHPAFWWDDNSNKVMDEGEQLSGIWVGKFSTSGSFTNPKILPDRGTYYKDQTISNQFVMSQQFNTYLTNADSHMMKNSEWGAVAYFSQSKYGKYGNSEYVGANKEIYINNSYWGITGRSGGAPGGKTSINETYPGQTNTPGNINYGFYTYDGYLLSYNTNTKTETRDINKGTGASTTGNITGVYDMSGGHNDYVMAVLADDSGNPRSGYNSNENSGFNGMLSDGTIKTDGIDFPESKYYDLYMTTTCSGESCRGHALNWGWYGDGHDFVSINSPWFMRGNYYALGPGVGIFSYGGGSGYGSYATFRVTISPTS